MLFRSCYILLLHDEETKKRIDDLQNFGFHNEITVVAPGINSKMDEMRSAYGLLNLRQVDSAIAARKSVAKTYYEALKDVKGVSFYPYLKESFESDNLHYNYAYMPMFVNAEEYGITRDELYAKMKAANVLGRRYFYPLISEFSTYRGCQGAERVNLPNAHKMADTVICLPMHHELSEEDMERVLNCIINK